MKERNQDFNNNKSEFFKHKPEENFLADEKKGIFKSWVLESIVPNNEAEFLEPREVYLEINFQEIKVYTGINGEIVENFKILDLLWNCEFKENSCSPSELIEFYDKVI